MPLLAQEMVSFDQASSNSETTAGSAAEEDPEAVGGPSSNREWDGVGVLTAFVNI